MLLGSERECGGLGFVDPCWYLELDVENLTEAHHSDVTASWKLGFEGAMQVVRLGVAFEYRLWCFHSLVIGVMSCLSRYLVSLAGISCHRRGRWTVDLELES